MTSFRGFPKVDRLGIDARIVLELNKFRKKLPLTWLEPLTPGLTFCPMPCHCASSHFLGDFFSRLWTSESFFLHGDQPGRRERNYREMMTESSSNLTELKIGTSAFSDEDFIRQEAQKYMMYKIGNIKTFWQVWSIVRSDFIFW